jgi:tetratricopeptide (TPR) repeat protein
MDDYGDFLNSVYSGNRASRVDEPVAQQSCTYCHMHQEPAVLGDVAAKQGQVTSHRFLGGHTHLAAMRGDSQNLKRISQFQKKAIILDVSAVRVNSGSFIDPARTAVFLKPSDIVEFDVTLFNSGVGHRFPGGTLDNQGTHLEVMLTHERGQLLAQSSAHQLRAQVVDAHGTPLLERQTHEFVAAVWNHTVKPREARTVRYRWKVPDTHRAGSALSLNLRVRLIHQSRLDALSTKACDASRTEEGARYEKALKELRGETLDGCASAPTTVLATARARVSSVVNSAPIRPEVHFRHALGLSLGFQEYLDDARSEAWVAFHAAQAVGNRNLAAQAAALLAQVSARQQHVGQTLFWAAQAEGWVGKHPALEKTRGELFASVFRFAEAVTHFQNAVKRNPGDIGLWQGLAASLGSSGKAREALEAAQEGLKLFPRDAACLRIQALSLRALKAPPATEEKAFEAALHWRESDLGPAAKAMCSKTQPGCAQKRNPVPVYSLNEESAVSQLAPSSFAVQ